MNTEGFTDSPTPVAEHAHEALPAADAVLYHSTPVAASARYTNGVAVTPPPSSMHLQGCVLWLSALSGSGVASRGTTFSVICTAATSASFITPPFVLTRTDIALGQPRAPPIA